MMTSPEKCQLLAAPPTKQRMTKEEWKALVVSTFNLLGLLVATLVGIAILVGFGFCVYWYVSAVSTVFDHINTGASLTATDGDVIIGSFFVGVAVFFIAVHLSEE